MSQINNDNRNLMFKLDQVNSMINNTNDSNHQSSNEVSSKINSFMSSETASKASDKDFKGAQDLSKEQQESKSVEIHPSNTGQQATETIQAGISAGLSNIFGGLEKMGTHFFNAYETHMNFIKAEKPEDYVLNMKDLRVTEATGWPQEMTNANVEFMAAHQLANMFENFPSHAVWNPNSAEAQQKDPIFDGIHSGTGILHNKTEK
jgi:hypothetical protein